MILTSILLAFLATYDTVDAFAIPKKSFGGKILLAPIPGVTCVGTGKLMVLTSNVGAAVGAVASSTNKDSSTGGKALGTAMALYNMIPIYTTNPERRPKPFYNTLGTAKMVPNFSTCKIGSVPIPVLKTTENYNISKKPSL
jgi:hypothetical protein